MKSFHAGWHLIYTKPCHEKKVNNRLTELKINSFLPQKKTLRIWHDRKKIIDCPLFPSYIFVHLSSLQQFYSGLDISGVLYYVRSGREVARVEDSVINNIKLAASVAQDIEVSFMQFQRGQQILISKGPLAGLACEVVELKNSQKILVRVDLLQRNLLLTLPEDCLTGA
jgi:transcription antitermination factor NusG